MHRAMAIAVVTAAAALVWTSSAALADPPAGATAFAIGKCVDPSQPTQQRPKRFAYNCDETGVMDDMTWTSWGADGAQGTGMDSSVECQPNCAEGTRLTNTIVVHAWNTLPPSEVGCPAGVQYFSDMTIAYPKGVPPWIDPGTSWSPGTEFVTVDGVPAVHFSDLKPHCQPF
jgi:hypothetical protein